jgi:hypothetical protein
MANEKYHDKWKMIAFRPSLKAPFSEVILVVVIVERLFLDNVQFNRIQTDDFKLNSTLFTIHCLAFVDVKIYVDVGITFRTRSGRHFFYLR